MIISLKLSSNNQSIRNLNLKNKITKKLFMKVPKILHIVYHTQEVFQIRF